jgi:hypothetical protein
MNVADLIAIRSLKVDQSHIKGEAGTGYEPPGKKGPFRCDNCEYFSGPGGNTCGQRTMMKLSKQPRVNSGRVIVDPAGCCEMISRIGKVK